MYGLQGNEKLKQLTVYLWADIFNGFEPDQSSFWSFTFKTAHSILDTLQATQKDLLGSLDPCLTACLTYEFDMYTPSAL